MYWPATSNVPLQTVLKNILKHEQEHERIYQRYYRDQAWWAEWAKTKKLIEVCVDDAEKAEEIVEKFLIEQETLSRKKYNEMLAEHDKLQMKVDQDERDAGLPIYAPMKGSNVLLSE